MNFTWTAFLFVLVLGVIQLAVGVLFGRSLVLRGLRASRPHRRNAKRLRRFAGRLFELVTSITEDVDQCQSQIEQINDELAAVDPGDRDHLTDFVLKLVARIMQINERLRAKLAVAEERLNEQARLIEAQLAEARTDALTGLPNRRAFDDELHRRIAEWQRKENTFSLMMIDIDHFKALNDRYGHQAGDQALSSVAAVLEGTLREMDMVARVGGEEFGAILPGTVLVDGCRASERVRHAVAAHWLTFQQTDLRITVSVGVAVVATGDDAAALIGRADEALYSAKRAGRNCGCFHDGRFCKRIEIAPAPPPGGDRPEQADQRDALAGDELAAAAGDLRDRLVEVAGETGR